MSTLRSRLNSPRTAHGRRCRPFLEPLEERRLLATFTVTDTGDSAAEGSGSLRRAILDSNAATGGTNTITFAIDTGSQTIALAAALPAITQAVDIDGTSQPGYSVGNPVIVLEGTGAGAGVDGLDLGATAAGSTIRGLVITGFGGTGLSFSGGSRFRVSSTEVLSNGGHGIRLTGTGGSTIGGLAAGDRNIVAGNAGDGILLSYAGSTGNIIVGNYVGTTTGGGTALPNAAQGIVLEDAPGNTIGGAVAAARNVIAGNTGNGIILIGSGSTGDVIAGNAIGLAADGSRPLPNGGAGIYVGDAAGFITPVTGVADQDSILDNVVSGNAGAGIIIQGDGMTLTAGVTIQGNLIGTDPSGTTAIANGGHGIQIFHGASGATIGGAAAGAGNLISGNALDGIILYGNNTAAIPTSRILIQGNVIGTDQQGATAVANGWNGVEVYGWVTEVTIGGTTAGAGNLVSGNTDDGLRIGNADADGTPPSRILIQGNRIGTDQDGGTAVPNGWSGIDAFDGISGITIGGIAAGAGNLISGNGNNGINVYGDQTVSQPSSEVLVQGNIIGADQGGATAVANAWNGVVVYGWVAGVTIGGTAAGAANLISGNLNDGINIGGAGPGHPAPAGILIQGNRMGTNQAGTKALSNGWDGVEAYGGASGITIGGTAAGAGNLISGNLVDGVQFSGTGTTNILVAGNRIGTDSSGMAAIANTNHGVRVFNGASGITIGGTAAAARNVISGNLNDGIIVYGSDAVGSPTSGIVVQGNTIGTDKDGANVLANGWNGVDLYGWVTDVTVGGTGPGAGNLISGNFVDGVRIGGADSNGTPPANALVAGNRIGTDQSGVKPLRNANQGVELHDRASGITIGGTVSGAGNVVSGNGNNGIGLGGGAASNLVAGNTVGLAADGATPLANVYQGIALYDGATGNTIGGTTPAAANLVAGNGTASTSSHYYSNFDIQDANTTGNLVLGNFIGTDARNDAGLNPSYVYGLFVGYGATGNTIGGADPGAGNVISGNSWAGLTFFESGTSRNVAVGNLIGLASDGASKLGNGGNGVDAINGASGNTIGGTTSGAGNVISGNASAGISLGSDDNLAIANLIGTDRTGVFAVGNGGLGIDVAGVRNTVGGVTKATQNANPFPSLDAVQFGGSGSAGSPEVLVAMGQDLGSSSAGFDQNIVHSAITLAGSTYVRLVDNPQDPSGTQPGAVYVNALTVAPGTTLDLAGLHLYARAAQLGGSVINGVVTEVPDAGPIAWGTGSSGRITLEGQVDAWTFFGRAGQAATLILHPGATDSPAPLAPQLNYGEITVLDPGGHVLTTASSFSFGDSVTIPGLVLPADGTYQVLVQAPTGQTSATGHYLLAMYDATVHTATASYNQSFFGSIASPYAGDRWTFTGLVGDQIRFNLLGDTDPALAFTLAGPNNYTAFTRLTTSSALLTLPASGSFTLTVDPGATQRGGSYSFRIDATSVTDLTLGTSYQGTLAGSGQAQLFRVAIPTNEALMVALQDGSSADQNEVYVKLGAPPTRSDYQYRSTSLAAANQQVLVPSAAPGSWYILVYGSLVPGPSTYTLTATAASIFLFGATPTHSSTSTDTTMTLTGAGFNSGTTVSLVAGNGTSYPLSDLTVATPTRMTAIIRANSVPAATYTVKVTQAAGGSASLPGAFTMVQGGQAILTTNVIIPNPIGYHVAATIYVQYSNTGDAPMPAPLLVLTAYLNDKAGALMTLDASKQVPGFWTSATPDGYSQSVQILASGSTPGILQPGDSMTVPVYYAGWLADQWDFSYPPVEFVLGALQTDNATLIDWASLEQSSRPPDVSPTAWSAIFANLQAQTGTTFGDYVRRLDAEASYLGSLGENVTDIGRLFDFEILQSNGLGPIKRLGGAIEAAAPAPGLPISFGRFFSPSISGRNQMGPLGLGWSDSWQVSLSVQSDGTVVVTGPGNARRTFQPDSRDANHYFAQAGDYGTLTPIGAGAFTLTEQNGMVTAFNADGTLDYVQDTNGNRINASYTGGLLTRLTHSAGQSIQIAYNAAGRIVSVTDPFDRATTYHYDSNNDHLLSVTTFDNQTTSYTYDTSSNLQLQNALTSIAYPDGTHADFTYDARGRLAATSRDGGAEMTTFAYGPGGEVDFTNADGATTKVYFDDRGLIARTQDPLGRTTGYTYDSRFNLVQTTDPAGQVTTNNYDAGGNLVGSTNPLGQTTRYTYTTTFHNLSSVTDARGNTTQYAYDGRGNLTSTAYADGTIASLAYDPVGNVLSSTDQNGEVIAYTHNAAGQVLTKTYAGGSVDRFTYDSHGNLVATEDATGTTTLTYDVADRLTRIAYPSGLYLTFTYDPAGRRTRMVDQGGFTVNYAYDAVGRLSKLTDGVGSLIVKYSYDPAGNLIRADMGNGTYTTYTFNAAGELLDLVNHAPDGSINSSFVYTYDLLGRRITETTLDGTWTYSYDTIGELTHAVLMSMNPAIASQDLTYNYDAVGNRTSTIINGVTTQYSTNNMNQYTVVGGTAFGYDANGNRISMTDPTETIRYAYNANNQLVGVSSPAGTSGYQYDALGHRVASTANSSTTLWLIDPSGLGTVVGTFTRSGELIANYTFGLGLTSQIDSSGASAYYDFDATGSTVGITGVEGTYSQHYRYLPFGDMLTAIGNVGNPYEYIGRSGVMDEGNGLNSMGFRYYDSTLGGFTQLDRLGASPQYIYCQNDPIDRIDPTGLQSVFQSYTIGFQVTAGAEIGLGTGITIGLTGGISVTVSEKGVFLTLRIGIGIDPGIGAVLGIGGAFSVSGSNREPVEDVALAREDAFIGFSNKSTASLLSHASDYETSVGLISPAAFSGVETTWKFPNSEAIAHELMISIRNQEARLLDALRRLGFERDPNSLTGPAGYGPANFVAAGTLFPYRVDFENAPTATAPAQRVVVTDPLDSNLDWSTFQLTGIGFGDTNITIPTGSQSYQTTVSMTYNGKSFDVDIQVGLNPATGVVTAVFQSVDPKTQLPPDVLTGFLPPEDDTGRGMGFLSFIIQPRANLPTGTEIRNVALITFGINPAIATDQVDDHDPSQGTDPAKEALVTIDAEPPTSSVAPLPEYTGTSSFTVDWSGSDGAGSGLASYDVYVSTDGGAFAPFVTGTTATSATFQAASGHTYAFYSVATDHVGDRQPTPTAAQASTRVVIPVDTTTTVQATENPAQLGDMLTFTATVQANSPEAPTPTGSVQFFIDDAEFGPPKALDNGSATSEGIATLLIGNHTVAAQYVNGDPRFNPGQGTLPGGETVDRGNVTVRVVLRSSELAYGQSSTFTTTIQSIHSSVTGLPTPGGSVQFQIDDAPFGASVSVVGGQAVSAGIATLAAGGHTITAQYLGDPNYLPSSGAASQTINKAHLTVTAVPQSKTYDGSTFTGFTADLNGFVNGDPPSVVTGEPSFGGSAVAAIDAGTYTITPGLGSLSAANYDFTSFVDGTLTISRAHLTVIADDQSRNYDSSTFSGFTAHYTGFVNDEPPSVVTGEPSFGGPAVGATGAGTYRITPGPGSLDAVNYDFTTFVNGSLTISKAHLTVTADPQAKVYGAPVPPLTYTLTGFVGVDSTRGVSGVPGLSTSATSRQSVGVYPIAINLGTLTAANYDFPNLVAGTLTITRAHLTIIADDRSRTYDGAAFTGFSAHFDGLVNGDSPGVVSGGASFSGPAVAAVDAGTYIITPGAGSLTTANYDFTTFVNGSLMIRKAHLTVIADDRSRTYDGSPFTAFTAHLGGLVAGDQPGVVSGAASFGGPAVGAVDAGTYIITPGAGSLTATNYDFTTFVNGTLTVTLPSPVTVIHVQMLTTRKHLVTQIVITFSGALDAAEAQDLGSYRLTVAGKKGSFTARNARSIALRTATYDAANHTVTLIPRKPFALTRPVQYQVNGQPHSGLKDRFGRLIDGDHDGQPGGDATGVLGRNGATIRAVGYPGIGRFSSLQPSLIDILLEQEELTGLNHRGRHGRESR